MRHTPLFDRHAALGARMVDFAGWEMPVQYPSGIVEEHLRTRREAGLFDVSHMGRFAFRGAAAVGFLQRVLTSDVAALEPGWAQYTMIPTASGGALDDAYLYRLGHEEYLLVVNAANREKDWDFFRGEGSGLPALDMEDRSEELAMLSLQGPRSREILRELATGGRAGHPLPGEGLPDSGRNTFCAVVLEGVSSAIARTGYTGEPLGFEIFLPARDAGGIWDRLLELGASPVGLGARDTLRLEAALPLYGHELGTDPDGREIPIFASPLARFAVSLSPQKGEFVGRRALERQSAAYRSIIRGKGDEQAAAALPFMVRPLSLLERGIARPGAEVFAGETEARGTSHPRQTPNPGRPLGRVTSGTVVPYWVFAESGGAATGDERSDKRAIALALAESTLEQGGVVEIDIRGRRTRARIVPHFLRSADPPYARPTLWQ